MAIGETLSAYVLMPLAKVDIFKIWSYVAEDNEDAADKVEREIYMAYEFVAESPLRGRVRLDPTTRPVRFWTLTKYSNYALVYRPDSVPLEIIAVLHGKRDIRRMLEQRR